MGTDVLCSQIGRDNYVTLRDPTCHIGGGKGNLEAVSVAGIALRVQSVAIKQGCWSMQLQM